MSVPDRSINPRLLASAEAEFLARGFIKAELKTICENAGITTGAVYKRYKGKEDLFCAVVDDIAEQLDLFVKERAHIDFSSLSDAEIYQSWQMTYDTMIPLFTMGMMFKAGMAKMNDYYTAAAKMNATIIEYVNGMEVVKVFGRDGESYKRYENDIKSYRDFTLAWYKIC